MTGEKLGAGSRWCDPARPELESSGCCSRSTDDHAVAGWQPEDHPRSVKTGRTNDDVRDNPNATAPDVAWGAPSGDELAVLRQLKRSGTWELGGRELQLTNLDKVMFPPRDRRRRPLTKRDLISHYAQSAPAMLPYLADRAVNMNRYPGGVGTKGFWHKEAPHHAPAWLRRWDNPDADPGETRTYIVPDSAASLAWLANFGALELHPWTSTIDAPHEPTWALFDIDPGDAMGFAEVLDLARLHRTALEHLGVDACPKITGKRGIQIWVPVATGYTFGDTRRWVETVSRANRRHRPRPRELGVGGRPRRWPGPARLHPERHQQDARRAVQHPPRRRRPGVGADPSGRTGRPTAAPRPLDHPRSPTTPRHVRRPPRPTHRPPATAADALTLRPSSERCAETVRNPGRWGLCTVVKTYA